MVLPLNMDSAGFARWIPRDPSKMLITFDDMPSESSAVDVGGGITMLGTGLTPEYMTAIHVKTRTIYGTPVPPPVDRPWFAFTGRNHPDGRVAQHASPIQEGDVVELIRVVFENAKKNGNIFMLNDGSCGGIIDTLNIACLWRGNDPVAFGPFLVVEPFSHVNNSVVRYPENHKRWEEGCAKVVSVGHDPLGRVPLLQAGDIVRFNHNVTHPYLLCPMKGDRPYWQLPLYRVNAYERPVGV